MLDKEYQYYLEQQEELLKQYSGKFLLIKDEKIVSVHDSEQEAYENAIKNNFELGTFLIQHCLPKGDQANIETFHSRVVLE